MRGALLRLLFVGYLALVAFAVFGPSPGDKLEQAGTQLRNVEAEVRSVVSGDGPDDRSGPNRSRRRSTFSDLDAEAVGNVVMFVPFGVFFPLVWPRRWPWTIPAGVALSGGIEAVQLLALTWRSPSLADIGLNGLGAAVGFVIWLLGSWARRAISGEGIVPPPRRPWARVH